MTVKITKREHPMWTHWKTLDMLQRNTMPSILGQWQYFYENEKTKISLVELPNYFLDGKDIWEICGGGLTEDVEKFRTKEEAEKRIYELLDVTDQQKD
jgi:hypothetical protein